MTPHGFGNAANECEKEILHGSPSLCLLFVFTWFLESKGKRAREKNLPLSAATLIPVAISFEGRGRDSHASSKTDTP